MRSPTAAGPAAAHVEIINQRVFHFPPAPLFAAFANPAQLAQWWGPKGFTNTIKEFDLRPGGHWRIVMRSADGVAYDNESVFQEVQASARIVYRHLRPMHAFTMTMIYTPVTSGKTELTWRMELEQSAENERLRQFLAEANEQNFDRLAVAMGGKPRL
jgi:uncharacterized protein YndB with AHSA1/START domain